MPEIVIVEMDIAAELIASDGYLSALQQTLVTRLEQEQGAEEDDHYPTALTILYEQRLDIEYEV